MNFRFLNAHPLFLLPLLIVLSLGAAAGPQRQKRIIHLFEADSTDEVFLEVIEIDVSGIPVTPGKPFESDENWIKNLRFKIKNVSGKPIVFFNFGGGMIEGMNEQLRPQDSYKEGLNWRVWKVF